MAQSSYGVQNANYFSTSNNANPNIVPIQVVQQNSRQKVRRKITSTLMQSNNAATAKQLP